MAGERKSWNSTLRPGKGFGPSKGFKKRAVKLKPKRRATGELALFRLLYDKQGGLCAITGLPLLPPGHEHFHVQGSHLLPKGGYPRARLWEDNVVMVLTTEHNRWERVKDKARLVDEEPRWAPYVERYHRMKHDYNTGAR